ncbi:MAG: hypothetical protein OXG24_06650 [Gammaproteobacteria bacterium]|nr:hypothetical protein [Gammaproteobacteria bacterium]
MDAPRSLSKLILARASEDLEFRKRLLANPKLALREEFDVVFDKDHEVQVHEESNSVTHLVLPPQSKFTAKEREAARTGATSLEFLKRTMYDPAPPRRPEPTKRSSKSTGSLSSESLVWSGRESIRRGLEFLESTVDENGAWHCVRFNVADSNIPRHFEKPPFVSALCVLAIEAVGEDKAKELRKNTSEYLVQTMEYPGLWRYYRHLPPDLDSTALCSMVIGAHPWISLGRSIPEIVANQDDDGRYMTWVLEAGEPDVFTGFRIEADPVVNANLIAFLGDCPETRKAQMWLEQLILEGDVYEVSKWYPDPLSIYYSVTRAFHRGRPAFRRLESVLVERILDLRDSSGGFGNVFQTAQAVSALDNVGHLYDTDNEMLLKQLIDCQREDGSWPEYLAFGDLSMKWGVVGQFGHGSESLTSAFCIEALDRLVGSLCV